jgi:hypothetical protein
VVTTRISHTLAQLVQDHREELLSATLSRLQREDEAPLLLLVGKEKLFHWFDEIVVEMERWPGVVDDEQAGRLHREYGAWCARQGVEPHELVRVMHVLKSKIVDFARSQGLDRNSLEIYVEQELEHSVSFLFDWLLYQAVLGYESALPLLLLGRRHPR